MPESIGLEAVMDMGAFNRAQSQYMGALDKMDAGTSGVAKAISGAMKGVAVGIGLAGAALVGVGSLAFKSGMAMDEAFDTLIIKTGASGKALEGMKADVNAVFTSIPTDVGKAAETIAVFARNLDYTGKGAQELSKQVLEASRLLKANAETTAEGLADVVKSWGMTNEQAAGTMDLVFKAAQSSGVGLDQLMRQLKLSGVQFRQMGFSVEESVAMIAKWEKAGLNSQQMLMTLRSGMGGLQRGSKTVTEALGGMSTQGMSTGEMLQALVKRIQNATTDTEAMSIGVKVFGARGQTMVEAIRAGNMAFEDMQAVLGDSTGAIMAASEATMDFPEKWMMVKNKMTAALAPIGMSMMDVVGTALDVFGPGMQKAAEWLGEIAGQISTTIGELIPQLQSLMTGGDIGAGLTSILQTLGFSETFAEDVGAWTETAIESVQGAITTIRESLAAFSRAMKAWASHGCLR
jgi:phage-related minor tail protein